MSQHFSSKRQKVYSSAIRQMNAYNEKKCLLSVSSLYDLGVTQGHPHEKVLW